jgi:tRNA(Glu) U13 pseudouridine synthase TruD
MADERTLVSGLSKGISEIGAIKKMRTANFFVHSYSSYLFNKALSGFLKQGHESARIEKIGASSKLDGLNQRLFAPILEKEGIALEDFKQEEKIFRIEGRPRNALFFPKRFCFSTRKNETVLKFALGKGEYASIVLNFLFESDLEKLD